MEKFRLGNKRPLIISGPCSAETEEQTLRTCTELAATGMVDVLRAGIWKPRTSPGSFEGVGRKGLKWMAKARKLTGLPIAVEVATPKHVELALEHGVDVLWIGARTTVSPFSMQEIADALSGNKEITVLVKNPINPDLGLWAGAVERLLAAGVERDNIGLIHRGFSYFGHNKYRNAPMWHLALEMHRRLPGMVMICDPSHIAGDRAYIREVSQAAADMRYDGLIIESHIDPDNALSDACQQVTPQEFDRIARSIRWREASVDDPEFVKALGECRAEIDQIDAQLFELMSRRMQVADKIGAIKRVSNVAILQGSRWHAIVDRIVAQAAMYDLSEEFLRSVLEAIHTESINRQRRIMDDHDDKSR